MTYVKFDRPLCISQTSFIRHFIDCSVKQPIFEISILKFLGSISDLKIYNHAKFRIVSLPKNSISKNQDFQDFGL